MDENPYSSPESEYRADRTPPAEYALKVLAMLMGLGAIALGCMALMLLTQSLGLLSHLDFLSASTTGGFVGALVFGGAGAILFTWSALLWRS